MKATVITTQDTEAYTHTNAQLHSEHTHTVKYSKNSHTTLKVMYHLSTELEIYSKYETVCDEPVWSDFRIIYLSIISTPTGKLTCISFCKITEANGWRPLPQCYILEQAAPQTTLTWCTLNTAQYCTQVLQPGQ